jgi:hypothetical protein
MLTAPRREPVLPIGRRIELANEEPDVAEVLEFGDPEGSILDDARCQQGEGVLIGQRPQPSPRDDLRAGPAPEAGLVNGVGGGRPEGMVKVDVDRPPSNGDGVVVAPAAAVAERVEHSTSAPEVVVRDEQVEVVLGAPGEIAIQSLGEDRPFEEDNGYPGGLQGVTDNDEGAEELSRRGPFGAGPLVDDGLHVAGVDATSPGRRKRFAHEWSELKAVQRRGEVHPLTAGRPQRIDHAVSVVGDRQASDPGAHFEGGRVVVNHSAAQAEAIGPDRRGWRPGSAAADGEGRACPKRWR